MSRAAYPAEDIYSWFHKHSSSDGLFCIESSNLNLTTRVEINQATLETKSDNATSAPLWLGIKLCLSSLAAARNKAQQTQTGQQHGIGFGFGNNADGKNLTPIINGEGPL